ncbi:helix-turn-helix domain-containing protein [Rubrivivax gelatinosus]|uniref:BetR domain-containing protein n=2 Tax=Rubrivivax gelatinosus TaxID=28068 RepID=A0A4R2MAS9_RUBGE|nr:helix-turn-helix domain-containing protein [Rubrivivax gelatinosus]TCP03590.1 BetR domain-containing protein [Rubrivivax gelatinosus]
MESCRRTYTPFTANVRAMIDADPLAQGSVNAWCKARKIPQSTVARWMTGVSDATLEQVDRVAQATGLQPWQLLHPEFDPHRAPPPLEPDVAYVARIFSGLAGADRTRAQKILEILASDSSARDPHV